VRHFLDIATYEPASQAEWDDTYSRFLTTREQVGQRGSAANKIPTIPSRTERNTDTND
jgi:hypothetical protein